uniref:Uncharacterized protein n=1 Tax=Arundo donax TaxID=35708 RepID=A0A0A9SXL8_ARUDO
MRGREAHTG